MGRSRFAWACAFVSVFFGALSEAQVSKVWSPDQNDGTYKNPILNADYSDPDAIRVGDRFYLVSSSFDSVPGLPILESYDLVNWHLLGHALMRQPPFDMYARTQHGNGVWAPSLRFHNGEFYLYYPDPEIGIYLVKAKDPAGPWSAPLLVKAAKGWIDPCPLWDTDGQAYLVSGLAGSRAGAKSALIVSRMKPDGTALLDDGAIVYDGHGPDPTVEGPKFYKRNGYYYIFAPAAGVSTGWQLALRSKNIYGPYERRKVLDQGTTAINGPHQGAWVDTGTGEDWFLHFQDRGWLGRIVHLEPMNWVDDWPVIGKAGQPVATYRKPHTLHTGVKQNPAESDEFNSPSLGLQWSWQADPGPTWGFPSQALGALRLVAIPAGSAKSLWDTPAVLFQKSPAPLFQATVKVTPHFVNAGDHAGLALLGKDYGTLVVEKTAAGIAIRQMLSLGADGGAAEAIAGEVALSQSDAYLRVIVTGGDVSFSYSLDGTRFEPLGKSFQAKPGVWIGAKVGLFAQGVVEHGEFGYADFDWFHVDLPLLR